MPVSTVPKPTVLKGTAFKDTGARSTQETALHFVWDEVQAASHAFKSTPLITPPLPQKKKQVLNIYNLFNKLMSFKIQCQNTMQLNMPVTSVVKHLCSCQVGGAATASGSWDKRRSGHSDLLVRTAGAEFLHSPPFQPHPPHTTG